MLCMPSRIFAGVHSMPYTPTPQARGLAGGLELLHRMSLVPALVNEDELVRQQ